MSDLMISRAALLNRMRERLDDLRSKYGLFDHYLNGFSDAIFMVGRSQSIEAEPMRHGQWATDKEDIEWGNSLKRKHCTNCGKRPHFDKEKREFVLTNYCPHCGAKMK